MLKVLSWTLAFQLTLPCLAYYSPTSEHPYYGEKFLEDLSSGTQLELEEDLRVVFNSFHLKQENRPDELSSNCQGKKGQTCYRHQQINYSDARAMVTTQLDLRLGKSGHYIWEVYCNRPYTKDDFPGKQAPNPKSPPDHDILNIEHTWPQSRFSSNFSKELQKGDLHHLYPSDNKVNSQRGNYPFAEISIDVQDTNCPETSRMGYVDENLPIPKKGGIHFEPPEHHRGNVARALFYFSVRYQLDIDPVEEYFLRKWNKEDPIDEEELERHEKIFLLQGSRNPFIDFPELADRFKDF